MAVYGSITEVVGNTPLVDLKRYAEKEDLDARILAKVEAFNPGGSVKDRIALAMIRSAEKDGILKPGATIVEPTSGNTGIGLAWVGTALGYHVILVMPDSMSQERRDLMQAYGGELVLTPGAQGMKGAIAKADEICKETPGAVILGQFVNPANPAIHKETTGPEIWKDTDGKVDILVAGVGTGGTISGTGEYLKEKNPDIQVIAVEPEASPVLSGGNPGPHKIQGIGAGFVPETLDTGIYNEVIRVSNEQAFEADRELVRTEGILAGISSGAALAAATEVARRPENKGKTIVVIFPDTGERYLSTGVFRDQNS